MNRWSKPSDIRCRGGRRSPRLIAVALGLGFATGCASHTTAEFPSDAERADEPRKPDGVAVDLEGKLPDATSRGSTQAGLVPLQEPVDFTQALTVVKAFFRAVADEDQSALEAVLAPDATLSGLGADGGSPADRFWERRFRKLDYIALGAEPLYRESLVETYRFDDLEEPTAGRPLRPSTMTTQDVLIRVPIARTRLGVDRLFGDEVLFLLNRTDRSFRIHAMFEEFSAP